MFRQVLVLVIIEFGSYSCWPNFEKRGRTPASRGYHELEAASGGASGTNNLAKQGAPFTSNAENERRKMHF